MRLDYHIAGKANCVAFAKALRIAEVLNNSLENFSFKKYLVHSDDWDEFIATACKERNFSHQESPLVWSYTGKYIGSCDNFISLVKELYDFTIDLPSAYLNDFTEENLAECKAIKAERDEEKEAEELKKLQQDKSVTRITAKALFLLSEEVRVIREALSNLRQIRGKSLVIQRMLERVPSQDNIDIWREEVTHVYSLTLV